MDYPVRNDVTLGEFVRWVGLIGLFLLAVTTCIKADGGNMLPVDENGKLIPGALTDWIDDTGSNADFYATDTLTYTKGFNGKCPICQFQGLKSTVCEGGCWSTLMYSQPYYDEDGRYHHYDPNTTTCGYTCSNGHSFSTIRQDGKCTVDPDYQQGMDKHDWPFREPNQGPVSMWNGTSDMTLTCSSAGSIFEWAEPGGYWLIPDPPSTWGKFWAWLLFGIEYK